jgi:S1-C subfamily serine protease
VQLGNRILIAGGDVVVGVDDRRIDTADELIGSIREKRPGERLVLEIYRRGRHRDQVSVLLEEQPRLR